MTTPDLFPVPETLSPFLAWKRELKVFTHQYREASADESAECFPPWAAWYGVEDPTDFMMNDEGPDFDYQANAYGYGHTEQEACTDLCLKHNIPHWLYRPRNATRTAIQTTDAH
jgi:hypothetical protein